jgi:hypothetical protein
MSANGNFRVVIAAHKDGFGVVSVKNIKNYKQEDIVDWDCVYGIQIGHRVVAQTENGPKIMTPTEAKKKGYKYEGFSRTRNTW